jgi:hypothetical protein
MVEEKAVHFVDFPVVLTQRLHDVAQDLPASRHAAEGASGERFGGKRRNHRRDRLALLRDEDRLPDLLHAVEQYRQVVLNLEIAVIFLARGGP